MLCVSRLPRLSALLKYMRFIYQYQISILRILFVLTSTFPFYKFHYRLHHSWSLTSHFHKLLLAFFNFYLSVAFFGSCVFFFSFLSCARSFSYSCFYTAYHILLFISFLHNLSFRRSNLNTVLNTENMWLRIAYGNVHFGEWRTMEDQLIFKHSQGSQPFQGNHSNWPLLLLLLFFLTCFSL